MMHGFPFVWMLVPFVFAITVYFIFVRPGMKSDRKLGLKDDNSLPSQSEIERKVYLLARKNGGEITVSDVVADIGLSGAEAERQLQSMSDGTRVSMEVSDDGVVTYRFREFSRHD